MTDPAPTPAPAPTTPANGTPPPAPTGGAIPLDRFTAVVRARDEALAQAATFGADLAAAQAQATTFQEQATTAAAQLAQLTSELALADAGLHHPEARLVARTLHGALPEDDRPDLSAWVAGLRADPSTSPVALRGYLQPASPLVSEPPPGSATVAGGGAGLPAAAGALPPPTPEISPKATLDAASAAFTQAMQTRDPAQMQTARVNLERALASLAQSTPVR